MKICIIGDAHFRLELPYASLFKDGRKGEWEAVKEEIHHQAESSDAVVLVGDVLNQRHNHSSVIKEFVDFLDGFGDKPVYVISGNHEVYEGTKTAIDFLKNTGRPNWHVFTPTSKIGVIDVGGKSAVFLPYLTNAALGTQTSQESLDKIMGMLQALGPADILFHHYAMSGTNTLGGATDLFDEPVLPREELRKLYSQVFGGHIHQPDWIDARQVVTGSSFTDNVGEIARYVWTNVYTEGRPEGMVVGAKLPVRPIYGLEYTKETTDDILNELTTLPRMSIIRVVLHNKNVEVEKVRDSLSTFDATILIEDYPNERMKAYIAETGVHDLSVPGLLKTYAKARGIDENELLQAFELIRA